MGSWQHILHELRLSKNENLWDIHKEMMGKNHEADFLSLFLPLFMNLEDLRV